MTHERGTVDEVYDPPVAGKPVQITSWLEEQATLCARTLATGADTLTMEDVAAAAGHLGDVLETVYSMLGTLHTAGNHLHTRDRVEPEVLLADQELLHEHRQQDSALLNIDTARDGLQAVQLLISHGVAEFIGVKPGLPQSALPGPRDRESRS